MITIQQTDIQNGEIFSIMERPCVTLARVAVRNGKVSELVDVELTKDEAANIDYHKVSIINRAVLSAACFQ